MSSTGEGQADRRAKLNSERAGVRVCGRGRKTKSDRREDRQREREKERKRQRERQREREIERERETYHLCGW